MLVILREWVEWQKADVKTSPSTPINREAM